MSAPVPIAMYGLIEAHVKDRVKDLLNPLAGAEFGFDDEDQLD